MQPVILYFSPDLHVFLLPQQRGAAVPFPLVECAPVKHPVEALGVPHTEVDAVTVNGHGVTLDHRLWGGERVHVYSRLDLPADSPLAQLLPPVRPALPRPPRFVLDTHLGRLAAHLRLFGFDTLYRNDYADDLLAAIAAADCVIDFTLPDGTLRHLDIAAARGVAAVIGTTGLDGQQKARVAEAKDRPPTDAPPDRDS